MTIRRIKTIEEYEQEMNDYRCLYYECREYDARQGQFYEICSYPHSDGWAVSTPTEFGDVVKHQWIYGVCPNCLKGWSLGKLRDAYGAEDRV